MEKQYQVVRFYQDNRLTRVIRKNLTLKQAREHCEDLETSSQTARKACHGDTKLIEKWHQNNKHWFDGFTEQ